MDKLNFLVSTLNEIQNLSLQILEESMMILNTLKKRDNYMVFDVMEDLEYEPDEKEETQAFVLRKLRETVLSYTNDARSVNDEIGAFTEAVIDPDVEDYSVTPFLSEVWHGDMYENKTKIDALVELRKELHQQLDEIDADAIVESVARNILARA